LLSNIKTCRRSASRTSTRLITLENLIDLSQAWRHNQPGQPITVGRRAAQSLQELVFDIGDIEYVESNLKFRGAQWTTGSQASFMELFNGDSTKVDRLNQILCEKTGFPSCYDISTQTYTRKVDLRVANALSSFGATAVRLATVKSDPKISYLHFTEWF
jgi:adenylosuccinate lyase